MMYPLVLDLADDGIPVAGTCRVLGFSKQAFYQWKAKPVTRPSLRRRPPDQRWWCRWRGVITRPRARWPLRCGGNRPGPRPHWSCRTTGLGSRTRPASHRCTPCRRGTGSGGVHRGVAWRRSDHRSVNESLATVTASGNHHMLVRYNGSRGDGGDMHTPVGEPTQTLTTVEDCTFRVLEPSEIQAAMALRRDYRVRGTRPEQVRQLGNAVTPPAAERLIRAVVESPA